MSAIVTQFFLAVLARLAAGRVILGLDGEWEFSLDPHRQGWDQGWSSGKHPLPFSCPVPGAWEAAGFGNATDRLWHSYTPTNRTLDELYPTGGYNTPLGGLGWYRKSITMSSEFMPDATTKLFLRVGGVHRQVTAFANGVFLGYHAGYLHELEWDISKAFGSQDQQTQEATLVIVLAVDSFHNMTIDPLMGVFDMGETPELNNPAGSNVGLAGPWGGIWGHVTLETRRTSWLGELFAQATNATVVASATLFGEQTGIETLRMDVVDCATKELVASSMLPLKVALDVSTGRVTITATMGAASVKMWSPNSPSLYNTTLSLVGGAPSDCIDSLRTRFGIKDLKIIGSQFVLNGQKLFLSGTAADGPFADTVAAPSDKEYHLKQARLMKSFGFNFMRCHSHVLPPEFYDALDEVGIFVSPELPISYQQYFTAACILGNTSLEAYRRGWAAAVIRHRNHPSIFDWSLGNEHIWDANFSAFAKDLYGLTKQLDPTRPVIASDGNLPYPTGATNPLIDFYSYQPAWDRSSFYNLPQPSKPVITHETGNYNTFLRIEKVIADLTPPAGRASKFLKPFWVTGARDHLRSLNLLSENDLWSLRSEQLYTYNYKQLVEGMRASPFISGYEWWCFPEFWMGGNGIVDYAFDLKPGVTQAAVKSYVGDVVLVLEDSGLSQAYVSGGTVSVNILLSNYGQGDIEANRVGWKVTVSGTTICSGSGTSAITVMQGTVLRVGSVDCKLPDLGWFPSPTSPEATSTPQGIELSAQLQGEGDSLLTNNSWTSRVYPMFRDSAAPQPLYIDDPFLNQMCMFNNCQELPKGASGVGSNAVVLATLLSDDVLAALSQNATVLLVGSNKTQVLIPTAPNKFQSCWWLGAPTDNNVGTVIYDRAHTILAGMDESGWCDGTWERMIDGSVTFIMEAVNASAHEHIGSAFPDDAESTWDPTSATIHIRGLDYILGGPRSKALLFEGGAKVIGKHSEGGGKLIATGLNLLQQFKSSVSGGFEHPEKAYLLWKLLEHAFATSRDRTSTIESEAHSSNGLQQFVI